MVRIAIVPHAHGVVDNRFVLQYGLRYEREVVVGPEGCGICRLW